MINKNYLIIAYIMILLFPVSAMPSDGWKLVSDSNGIQIYNKEVPGSMIKEVRGVAVIEAPIEVIIAVMMDIQAETIWMNRCIEAKPIRSIDPFAVTDDGFHSKDIIYNAIGAPFPVSNRDMVLVTEMTGDYNTNSMMINIHSVTDPALSERSGFVRITDLTASWFFQGIDEKRTKAVYQVKQNPGGGLSDAIINYTNKIIPLKTIAGLRKISKTEKYMSEGKKLINEKLIRNGKRISTGF